MNLDPHGCWDCPITIVETLGQFALVIVVAFIGLWLLRRRAVALRALGVIAITLTSFMVVTLPVVVPRWGVYRWGSETDLYPAAAVRFGYIAFIGIFLLVNVYAYRRGRRVS